MKQGLVKKIVLLIVLVMAVGWFYFQNKNGQVEFLKEFFETEENIGLKGHVRAVQIGADKLFVSDASGRMGVFDFKTNKTSILSKRELTEDGAKYLELTKLAESKILIVAPKNNEVFTEVYDVEAKAFVETEPMKIPRLKYFTTVLNEDSVLIAGGKVNNKAVGDIEILDLKERKYKVLPFKIPPISGHHSIRLSEAEVLLLAGEKAFNSETGSLLINLKDGSSKRVQIPIPKTINMLTKLSDNSYFIMGNNKAGVLDVNTFTFKAVEDVPVCNTSSGKKAYRVGAIPVVLASRSLLIIGGGAFGSSYVPCDLVLNFEVENNRFKPVARTKYWLDAEPAFLFNSRIVLFDYKESKVRISKVLKGL